MSIKIDQSIISTYLKRVVPFLTLFLLVCTQTAHAEIDKTGLYTGALFSNSSYKSESGSSKQTIGFGHAKIKVGKYINDMVSAEGQLGITTNTGASKGNITYGAYARIDKDIGQYKLYGLLGLGGLFAYEDGTDDLSETSFSYGAGIEIFGTKDLAVTFEYLVILDTSVNNSDVTFDTVGLGFTFYFTEDTSYFNKNRNKIRSIRY